MNDTIDIKARKLKLTIHLPQMSIYCAANSFWRLSRGPIDLVSTEVPSSKLEHFRLVRKLVFSGCLWGIFLKFSKNFLSKDQQKNSH